jgi:hypothetical protein
MIELSEISSQYDSSEEEHVVSNVKNSSVLNKNSTLHKISSSSSSSSYPHVRTVATAASISRSCKNDTNAKALQLHIASRKKS